MAQLKNWQNRRKSKHSKQNKSQKTPRLAQQKMYSFKVLREKLKSDAGRGSGRLVLFPQIFAIL
jgi:hypothetical protein